MKKLLTEKEHITNSINQYNDDCTNFETVSAEIRGTMKTVYFDMDMNNYILFKGAIRQLGLEDYVQMEYDNSTVVIRIIEDEE